MQARGFGDAAMRKPEANSIEALQQNCERASELMRTLGNKWRMLVVWQLAFGEKTVSELGRETGLAQSALSQHLMVLRHRELVSTRRSAQNVYYSLSNPVVLDILRTMHTHFCEAMGILPRQEETVSQPAPADAQQ